MPDALAQLRQSGPEAGERVDILILVELRELFLQGVVLFKLSGEAARIKGSAFAYLPTLLIYRLGRASRLPEEGRERGFTLFVLRFTIRFTPRWGTRRAGNKGRIVLRPPKGGSSVCGSRN